MFLSIHVKARSGSFEEQQRRNVTRTQVPSSLTGVFSSVKILRVFLLLLYMLLNRHIGKCANISFGEYCKNEEVENLMFVWTVKLFAFVSMIKLPASGANQSSVKTRVTHKIKEHGLQCFFRLLHARLATVLSCYSSYMYVMFSLSLLSLLGSSPFTKPWSGCHISETRNGV